MKVLVFAPHNDDEILGVGGTMAKHIADGDEVYVCEATASNNLDRRKLLRSEARKAHELLGVSNTYFLDFPPVELPHQTVREFNGAIAGVVKTVEPDIVYLPFYGDMHKDHTVVADAVMVAVRPLAAPFISAVYAYETLSETGWNYPTADKTFIPNVYVDITDHMDTKIEAMKKYASQIKEAPHPRSEEGLRALATYRGGTVGAKYAEAFMCIREIRR